MVLSKITAYQIAVGHMTKTKDVLWVIDMAFHNAAAFCYN